MKMPSPVALNARGNVETTLHFAIGDGPLGKILVAGSSKGIAAVFLGDEANELIADLQNRFKGAALTGDDTGCTRWASAVARRMESPQSPEAFELPLAPTGTLFQQQVWSALQKIPVGSTASYSQIAERIGVPSSARAVARGCASNPIAVLIPCHRVVRQDGGLSGYRWGIERKRALLERERTPSSITVR